MKVFSVLRAFLLSSMLVALPLYADGKVNINTASASELSEVLAGVGDKKAKDIVAYRNKNGSFKTVDDLEMVSGIGAATVNKNRNRIVLSTKK